MMKNVKKRLKNERGLTLIELLAVIVILGIIAAIAIPSIGGIISKSNYDAAKSDAIQLLNAGNLLVSSEGGKAAGTYASGASAGAANDPAKLKQFVEITDKNLSSWTVTIETDGSVTINATSKHKSKSADNPVFQGNLQQVNEYDYDSHSNSTSGA